MVGGGLLGALIGILGGPLGIVLGFTAGALLGESYDINHEQDDMAVLTKISQALPEESTGLLIDAYEESEDFIDALFDKTGATIYRWSFDDVQSEIEASVEAWHESQRIANVTLKQQKRLNTKQDVKQNGKLLNPASICPNNPANRWSILNQYPVITSSMQDIIDR